MGKPCVSPACREKFIHVKCCARESLYSNSMVIADWMLLTKSQHILFKCTWLSKRYCFCQYFTSENILCLLLSLIYPAFCLLNKDRCELSVSRYSTWVMPKKGDIFFLKSMEGIFVYVLEYMLTLVSLDKMQNISTVYFNAQKFEIWRLCILKVIQVYFYCTQITTYIGCSGPVTRP